VLLLSLLLGAGCTVGPEYKPPEVSVPEKWKAAAPSEDSLELSKWWSIFEDPILNRLEEDALSESEDLRKAAARVDEARAMARIDAADFYPTLQANPSYSRFRYSENRPNPIPFPLPSFTGSQFKVPFDLSYEVDIWGRVRRAFESATADAQAAAAAYYTVLLTLSSDIARNYFELRSLDAEILIIQRSITMREESLNLVRSRFDAGLASGVEVAEAQILLAQAEAQVPDVRRRRAELENAIAVLCSKNPSEFQIVSAPLDLLPPEIPPGLPSDILKQRPDILEAEREVGSASAQIGVAKAAFFPRIRLTGAAGFESAELSSLFDWESRIWSWGPSISIPLLEGGRNKANLEAAKARYEQSLSNYRLKVLTAFREVEDALGSLRALSLQANAQAQAVASAAENHSLASSRYQEGLTSYIEVLDAERTRLEQERAAVQVLAQRFIQTIYLIKALGGDLNPADPPEPERILPEEEPKSRIFKLIPELSWLLKRDPSVGDVL
jgi:outer membrane protein, multidrug efflux system